MGAHTSPRSVPDTIEAEYVVLQLVVPFRDVENVGILLLNCATGALYWRLRCDWDQLADSDDVEILKLLDEDFRSAVASLGGRKFLASLENSLSNTLRVSDRRRTAVTNGFELALHDLFTTLCLNGPHVSSGILT